MADDRSTTTTRSAPFWAFGAFVVFMSLTGWQHRRVMQSLEKDLQLAEEARTDILALRNQLGRVEHEVEQLKTAEAQR
ncbi:hypothetical protein [Planctomyces sp. SH-PL14]|uniref:hypothetical protein n=1 Tax=Planctomyces sp. SH-PL14 TaxID=1632864 RepID=UPI00078EC708|nr:hypothetical protein [Planctomyces sp. SH-PL14]AMV19221.1 hypothetical protein VT03_15125 [Planctomyces sp. SH-PL14]